LATTHEAEHDVRHPTIKQYAAIAAILFAITIVEFILIWPTAGIDDDLGLSKIPLLIFLSAIKFAIVILFYMHLKFDHPLFLRVFIAGLALAFMVGLALMGLFTAIKGESRAFAEERAVPFVHEGEHVEAHPAPTTVPQAPPTPIPTLPPSPFETLVPTAEPAPAGEETPAESVVLGPGAPLGLGVNGDVLEFDASSMSGSAGETYTLTLTNTSTVNSHNWVLVQSGTGEEVATEGANHAASDWVPPGDSRVFANTPLIAPGATGEVTFVAPGAGAYQFVCTFPAHQFTMTGTFTVN
jgi:azurin